ncbi:hypothetical protein F0L74_11115 [Chitinophaga agrisoli]|uniref:TonB-dependent receptor-like protein n=1 Tax=Chitinophaga agrisoli TaxID=2607653 RepID=A0A5B2VUZ5_9BACT|nr:hypothetical protein [Chitinophaga agrisoli]KAA2243061.1 hypothetical protein F0L74_11115 [Chitinophaga agrisoli]
MKQAIIIGSLLLCGFSLQAQDSTDDAVQVYIIDSVEVDPVAVNELGPDQIAMITIARGRKTVEKYGDRATNGVFYIETKPFARKRYNRMFSSLSPAYAAALQKYGNDSSFRYIMSDSVITTNPVSQLAALEKKEIADVQLLSAADGKKRYGLKEEEIGVVITIH